MPSGAIKFKRASYVIDPDKCTECKETFETQQCAAVCPGRPKTCGAGAPSI